MGELTHISLFAGIGGIDIAAEWAGFRTILFVEIDAFCQKVLNKHWPDVPIIGDIKDATKERIMAYSQSNRVERGKWTRTTRSSRAISNRGSKDERTRGSANLQPVTLITGGFPCQPVSAAGKRKGKEDDRWLWPDMLRVISEVRPTWVVAENVTGLLTMGFYDCLSDLEGQGYETIPFVIPACGVNAPHRRDRIFIVAYSRDKRWGRRSDGDEERDIRTLQAEGPGSGDEQEDVADTEGGRFRQSRDSISDEIQQEDREKVPQVSSRDAPDSEEQRLPVRISHTRSSEEGVAGPQQGDWWAVESELGGAPDGFPSWLYRHCGRGLSYGKSKRKTEALRELWNDDVSKALWFATRGYDRMEQAEILFAFVCEYEAYPDKARLLLESAKALVGFVFSLWKQGTLTSPPLRPEDREQWEREYTDSMQELPRLLAYTGEPDWQISSWENAIPCVAKGIKNRVNRLKCLGNAVVPQQIYPILKAIAEIERWT